MSTQTAQDLQAAHDYLQANGWCQNEFVQGIGIDFKHIDTGGGFEAYCAYHPDDVAGRPVCLEGALYVGAGLGVYEELQHFAPVDNDTFERYGDALAAICRLLPGSSLPESTQLWLWNDYSLRTVEEVKNLLLQAIENELAQDISSALA